MKQLGVLKDSYKIIYKNIKKQIYIQPKFIRYFLHPKARGVLILSLT